MLYFVEFVFVICIFTKHRKRWMEIGVGGILPGNREIFMTFEMTSNRVIARTAGRIRGQSRRGPGFWFENSQLIQNLPAVELSIHQREIWARRRWEAAPGSGNTHYKWGGSWELSRSFPGAFRRPISSLLREIFDPRANGSCNDKSVNSSIWATGHGEEMRRMPDGEKIKQRNYWPML